jgi:hypothetical protein
MLAEISVNLKFKGVQGNAGRIPKTVAYAETAQSGNSRRRAQPGEESCICCAPADGYGWFRKPLSGVYGTMGPQELRVPATVLVGLHLEIVVNGVWAWTIISTSDPAATAAVALAPAKALSAVAAVDT